MIVFISSNVLCCTLDGPLFNHFDSGTTKYVLYEKFEKSLSDCLKSVWNPYLKLLM